MAGAAKKRATPATAAPGAKAAVVKATPVKVDVPQELVAALAENARAKAYFEQMPPSHRREHVGYILEAKKDETRAKRAAQTIPALLKWGEEREAKLARK